ncbi:fucolectin-like [Crassostrea angulata]|uniref:fucolectin-like n=1 Tax=Magallana angulata TaxID=2784310 RepID=UPI0022B16822|nr:fucolectin-like [Crassostrea angulata]
MEKVLCLMTVALIIAVADAGHQRSKKRAINQSVSNPCQNGGTFTNNDGCFTCTCADGWAGALCNEVVSELASGKPVKQSTTYYSSSANFAVDGNKGTDFSVHKCACTNVGDLFPWWSVDLQDVYNITSVRIINRGKDSSGIDVAARLRYVNVTVGQTESDVNTPCGFFAGPGTASQLVVIDCPSSPQGRFVKIFAETEYLTLCEVEVFGF